MISVLCNYVLNLIHKISYFRNLKDEFKKNKRRLSLNPFIVQETKKCACFTLHNAVQITGPLKRTKVPQNMLNTEQL